jgi:hypothetical protein
MAREINLREVDAEKLYTLSQMAQFLRCSYQTVLKLKKTKAFPIKKVGKQCYVRGKDIIGYVTNE